MVPVEARLSKLYKVTVDKSDGRQGSERDKVGGGGEQSRQVGSAWISMEARKKGGRLNLSTTTQPRTIQMSLEYIQSATTYRTSAPSTTLSRSCFFSVSSRQSILGP